MNDCECEEDSQSGDLWDEWSVSHASGLVSHKLIWRLSLWWGLGQTADCGEIGISVLSMFESAVRSQGDGLQTK